MSQGEVMNFAAGGMLLRQLSARCFGIPWFFLAALTSYAFICLSWNFLVLSSGVEEEGALSIFTTEVLEYRDIKDVNYEHEAGGLGSKAQAVKDRQEEAAEGKEPQKERERATVRSRILPKIPFGRKDGDEGGEQAVAVAEGSAEHSSQLVHEGPYSSLASGAAGVDGVGQSASSSAGSDGYGGETTADSDGRSPDSADSDKDAGAADEIVRSSFGSDTASAGGGNSADSDGGGAKSADSDADSDARSAADDSGDLNFETSGTFALSDRTVPASGLANSESAGKSADSDWRDGQDREGGTGDEEAGQLKLPGAVPLAKVGPLGVPGYDWVKSLSSGSKKLEYGSGVGTSRCSSGTLFVYHLPKKFNFNIVKNCGTDEWGGALPKLTCKAWEHSGMGTPYLQDGVWMAEDAGGDMSMFGDGSCWYDTHMYSNEPIYHARMLQHPCRVDDPDEADLFYVPYYAAFDLVRTNHNPKQADKKAKKFLAWLMNQPHFVRNGGNDHFVVLGMPGVDFRCEAKGVWGTHLLRWPIMENVTTISVDRLTWRGSENMGGSPYPTFFHPSTDEQIRDWQARVLKAKRKHRATFIGSISREEKRYSFSEKAFDFRYMLMLQCKEWVDCHDFDCQDLGMGEQSPCKSPGLLLKKHLSADFCLQPKGDQAVRKSTIDCMLAGGIPVFFDLDSGPNQWHWHLPVDRDSWSVYINSDAINNGSTTLKDVLSSYSAERIEEMHRTVVLKVLPGVITANPEKYQLKEFKDAVDLVVDGMLTKVSRWKTGLPHQLPNSWLYMNKPKDKQVHNLLPIVPQEPIASRER